MNKFTALTDFTRYLIDSEMLSNADMIKVLDLAQDFIENKRESNDE